jgi:hypothetical protein
MQDGYKKRDFRTRSILPTRHTTQHTTSQRTKKKKKRTREKDETVWTSSGVCCAVLQGFTYKHTATQKEPVGCLSMLDRNRPLLLERPTSVSTATVHSSSIAEDPHDSYCADSICKRGELERERERERERGERRNDQKSYSRRAPKELRSWREFERTIHTRYAQREDDWHSNRYALRRFEA